MVEINTEEDDSVWKEILSEASGPIEDYSDENKYYPNLSPENNKILAEVNVLIANYIKSLAETRDLKLYGEKQLKIIAFVHELEDKGFSLHNYILGYRIKGGELKPGITELDTPNRDIEKFIRDLYKE